MCSARKIERSTGGAPPRPHGTREPKIGIFGGQSFPLANPTSRTSCQVGNHHSSSQTTGSWGGQVVVRTRALFLRPRGPIAQVRPDRCHSIIRQDLPAEGCVCRADVPALPGTHRATEWARPLGGRDGGGALKFWGPATGRGLSGRTTFNGAGQSRYKKPVPEARTGKSWATIPEFA